MSNETVNGFSSISTRRYTGFTEEILSEMAHVIMGFYQMPLVQSLRLFYSDLNDHVFYSKDAHNIDLSENEQQFVSQLFSLYRQLGFTGTKQEMMLTICKLVMVATNKDLDEGYRQDVGVNCPGWQRYFNRHSSKLKVHKHLAEIFNPSDTPRISPSIYFSSLFPNGLEGYQEDGVSLKRWNQPQGTLSFFFLYNFGDQEQASGEIFRIINDTDALVVAYNYNKDKDLLQMQYIYEKKKEEVFRCISDLYFGADGFCKGILVYDEKGWLVEDLRTIQTCPFSELFVPKQLIISAPITGYGTGLKEIIYYPNAVTSNQRKFFLQ